MKNVRFITMMRIRIVSGLLNIFDGLVDIFSMGFVYSGTASAYFMHELPKVYRKRNSLEAVPRSKGSLSPFRRDSVFSNGAIVVGGFVDIIHGIIAVLTLGTFHVKLRYLYIHYLAVRYHRNSLDT